MAKRKPASASRNRDLEALGTLALGAGVFFAAPLLPLSTGSFGSFLREAFYQALGLPAYLLPPSLFLLGAYLFRNKPLKSLLRHLLFLHLLAFALLHPKGLIPKGWEIAVVQSRFFEVSWGPIGRAIFLLVAAAFLADSWLGLVDAISRMHSDFFYAMFDWAKRWTFRTWYYIFVTILTLLSVVTIPLAQPGTLLLIGGVLNFIVMAIYCPFLIYLNY
ncbi:MAG: DNA translocase FtsK 4TM domain-containing protein, partial [Thermus sp.]